MLFYKKENELIKHVILTEQLESLNNQHFMSNEYVSNLRVNRVTGDKRQLVTYRELLISNGYSTEIGENISLHPTFGIINKEGGMIRIQNYLRCFNQIALISVNSERLTNFQNDVFDYLILSNEELCKLILEKIRFDYSGTKKGVVGLWEAEEVRDSFPPLNSDADILNLLSQIDLSIYDEESMNHESSNGEVIEIRANCPWDIEHGINFMIYKNEIAVTNN